MKKMLLAALLLGSVASAQLSVMNIPALPPGKVAPTPAPTVPAPSTAPSTSTDRPTVTTLPATGTPLAIAHLAALSGPDTVTAGEAGTWEFQLTNRGQEAIKLQHGACDVRFEVLNTAGEVVRPDPKNGICTMQLVYTDIAPGQTGKVQNIRWEGKDAQGNPVPAGQYTIRARFNGSNQFSEVAQLTVNVR